MKMRALLLGAAAAVVLTGTASAGYERDGWYVGLEAGMVRVNETDFAGTNVKLELDDGMAALGTAGYAFKNSNWRIEGEVGYRSNEGERTICTGTIAVICNTNDVELEEWSGMLNALYDFNLNSQTWGLSLGAGIGIDKEKKQNKYERKYDMKKKKKNIIKKKNIKKNKK